MTEDGLEGHTQYSGFPITQREMHNELSFMLKKLALLTEF